MIRCQIALQWSGVGSYWLELPVILDTPGEFIACATDQRTENMIPNPNLAVAECVLTDDHYQAILDHADWGAGCILWSDEEITNANQT